MEKILLSADEVKKLSEKEALDKFSSSEGGLTSYDANSRVEVYGRNEIEEKKANPLLKFLGSFWGPIPWMIEIAAILSAVIHHWEDFFIIVALLLLNAIVGFWQEHKADNAIELLKQKLALKAKVLRDGKWIEVAADELVPGDVVRVRFGEILPADVKLFKGDYLETDESALTGESLPVKKEIGEVAYSGSVVKKGEMDALVVATGMNTFFGKTAKLVESAQTQSHFQKAVIKIGDYLIVLAVALVAVIFVVALFRDESWLNTLQFALVLTVAAIPVALPAVLSVTLAVGATALAKKEAIVSKLVAIEEMAGMDILCSDKTGTITKNELTLAEVEAFGNYSKDDVLLYATLASRAEDKDPIDDAIITGSKSVNAVGDYTEVEFHPFDPVSKRTESTVKGNDGNLIRVTKGAPQVILDLSSEKGAIDDKVNSHVDNFAGRGYRALGVAMAGSDGCWHFVGLIPLYDPPREDSAETISLANSMGVEVKMVTGDHSAIAKEIAGQVGLKTHILSAQYLIDKSDSEVSRIVENADGFAQVFPEHKYKIVDLLQKLGHFVGMTGDGVNDAPALKKADAGIAVDGATDAAKSAADIVLTRPGLSVIIDAIKESRKIFQRMNSYAIYRIAETIRVLLFIVLSILVFNFYPVTAIMIVLLALFNDAPIMSIAYDNVRYSNEPEKWSMRVVLGAGTFLGIIGVIVTFSLFYIGDRVLHLDHAILQTFMFLKLAVAGHLTIFMTRTRGPFWSIMPSAALFWSAVVTKILATLLAVYGWYVTPIGWKLAGLVWGYAILELIVTDFLKVRLYRILDHEGVIFNKHLKHKVLSSEAI
ncbi:MAG: plasma-membrane proton-efflux P-type ATPase [Deltaproteobacteria bacterium]|jgi:H+-transporting ATPase|nr:plasma-membrane proton-efflux P-type ATPase [Deltaproteobacteria bacterium]